MLFPRLFAKSLQYITVFIVHYSRRLGGSQYPIWPNYSQPFINLFHIYCFMLSIQSPSDQPECFPHSGNSILSHIPPFHRSTHHNLNCFLTPLKPSFVRTLCRYATTAFNLHGRQFLSAHRRTIIPTSSPSHLSQRLTSHSVFCSVLSPTIATARGDSDALFEQLHACISTTKKSFDCFLTTCTPLLPLLWYLLLTRNWNYVYVCCVQIFPPPRLPLSFSCVTRSYVSGMYVPVSLSSHLFWSLRSIAQLDTLPTRRFEVATRYLLSHPKFSHHYSLRCFLTQRMFLLFIFKTRYALFLYAYWKL